MSLKSRFAGAVAVVVAGQLAGTTILQDKVYALPVSGQLTSLEEYDPLSRLLHLQQYNETESSPSSSGYDSGRSERDPGLEGDLSSDDRVVKGVVWIIANGGRECEQGIRPEYRFDCIRNALSRAASTIDNRPGYRQAARELRGLSRKLNSIVTKYQDTSAPRVKKGQRSYRAVAKESLAQANREAAAAIDETVTKLLRSAGNSEKRKAHYSQIATAVGSTKRLLRS